MYRWSYHGALIVAWSVVCLSYAAWAPSRTSFFQASLIIAVFWIPVRVATILLHELAHLVAGALVGYRTWGFTLGTGEVTRRFRLGGWRIQLTPDWAGGSGSAMLAPAPGAASLWKERIVLLAPYLAHGSVAFLAWPTSSGPWQGLGWFVAATQLWYCVWNLWPRLRQSDIAVTDGMALERIRARPAWVLAQQAWLAARYEVAFARDEGTAQDAERALEAAASAWKGTPEYRALEYAIRWPDSTREPQRETLVACAWLTDDFPELSTADRFAIGDPPGDHAADYLQASWLHHADRRDRLVATLRSSCEASTKPVERAFWQALYALDALLDDADPPQEMLTFADEASAALPWYDVALVAGALADLVRNEPEAALRRIESATNYQRPGSAIALRDGVCAIALARQGQRHRARALWSDLSEYHPGPALCRRVERELGLSPGESEEADGV